MTTVTQRELAVKCIESALAHLGSITQRRYDGAAVRDAEPVLVEAMAGLETALVLVRLKPDLRVAPDAGELEPWMERAHDSEPC